MAAEDGREAAIIRSALTAALLVLLLGSAAARADELFDPLFRVLSHPRCTNCHTDGAEPLQRNARPHVPPVQRGSEGRGVDNLTCVSCHGDRNTAAAPGAPDWRMPKPDQAVFRGRSAAALCEQVRDAARNGGLDAEGLGRHLAEDPLVGWAWRAGAARPPPPVTREEFTAATIAWLRAGAPCPAK